MAEHYVDLSVTMRIMANEKGEAALDRYVGLPEPNEWHFTPGLTRPQVELGLCQSVLYTGRDDASLLDGWADLERGDLMVYIDSVEEGY